jgi:hypothetical protein
VGLIAAGANVAVLRASSPQHTSHLRISRAQAPTGRSLDAVWPVLAGAGFFGSANLSMSDVLQTIIFNARAAF